MSNEADNIPTEWYMITSPQEITITKGSVVKTIDQYGTNNPQVNYGATQLRKLSLGDIGLYGFIDGKEVEGNVRSLEQCMQMTIDEGSGYASPFCWKVFAGDKSYGTFVITSVNVDEQQRDLSGKATTAIVGVELQEVPAHQVAGGTDITGVAASPGRLTSEAEAGLAASQRNTAADQDSAVRGARGRGGGAGGAGGGGNGAATPGVSTSPSAPGSSTPTGPPRPDYETRYNTERGIR